jgi:uncharacterized membrane protein YuzA (DUF378 family)
LQGGESISETPTVPLFKGISLHGGEASIFRLVDATLVSAIFGEASAFSRVIYSLVGLSALYDVFSFTFGFKAIQHRWCELPATMKN